ncbi:MAG TPA: DNA-formamidopyrimidine glycosylase family protein [Pseudonocardiaceae bacterium]
MPEGDTVFLTGRRLDEALAGRRLVRADLRHPALATERLAGLTVTGVGTVGKHLLTRLDDGRTLHSHLRMDGSWHLYRPGRPWRGGPMHDVRVIMEVGDRVAVGYRLHDLALVPTAREDELVGHLGPDLLHPDWGEAMAAEAVARLTADPARELGLALMDQRVMAGLGNLYRAEVCFLQRVSPWAPVSATDPAAVVALAHTLLERNAWRPEQSTTGELARGAQHWVYGRRGRPCRVCGTRVRTAWQGEADRPEQERIVYFCPSCQPMRPARRSGASAAGAAPITPTPPPGRATVTAPRVPTRRRSPRSSG